MTERPHDRDRDGDQDSPLIDAENKDVRPPPTSVEQIEHQYLSVRDGTNLREETVTTKGRAKRWTDVVDAFEDYIWKQHKAAGSWVDEKGVRPTSHRFTEQASKDRYARTLGADRAAYELWGDNITTIHLVRRAGAFGTDGQPQPPADHLDDLLAANSNVYRAYRRHIKDNHGLTYARLSVLEPHRNGYAHIHDGLWVHDPEDIVCEADLYPALDSHVRAVDQARPRSHGPDAVDVRNDPERRASSGDPDGAPPTSPLPRELGKFLAGLPSRDDSESENTAVPNVLHADRGPLRFYALLWARGVRQWRPDREAFPYLVKASQELFGDSSDVDDDYVVPEDVEASSTVPTVDADSRPSDYNRPSYSQGGGTNAGYL